MNFTLLVLFPLIPCLSVFLPPFHSVKARDEQAGMFSAVLISLSPFFDRVHGGPLFTRGQALIVGHYGGSRRSRLVNLRLLKEDLLPREMNAGMDFDCRLHFPHVSTHIVTPYTT